MENTQTIEIKGVKYEIDLAGARKITAYRVGDRVKVLKKEYNGYAVHVGAIIGIDTFQSLPSVVVAYLPTNAWSDPQIQFSTLNAQSTDIELSPLCGDEISPTTETILGMFSRKEAELERQLDDLRAKRDYFKMRFGASIESAVKDGATCS